ncbi:MAG: DNA-binding protein WhiA [Acholeplasmataceae bacterium]|nr:MAG: DNA-binding protein WhiA [Acholeplasmataceae bacterium]
MSFARTVKEELVSIPASLDEQLAEFAAFLNLSTEFHIENRQKMLDFKTNNPTVAKRFLQLVRSLYQAETSLMTKKQVRLKRRQTVIIRLTSKIDDIINEHSLMDNPLESQDVLTQSEDQKRAYLRAAFLAAGSVNHPKTAEYHLEIYAQQPDQIVFLQQLMNAFDLNARIIERRNGYITYLKDAEKISHFLAVTGAQNSVFQFEDLRIKRDFNNSINRVMNCEIANEKKTIIAANEQIKDIEVIEKYLKTIDNKTQQVMTLRKANPEANLRELVEKFEETYQETISRSGMNHRLVKIRQMANQIREGLKP